MLHGIPAVSCMILFSVAANLQKILDCKEHKTITFALVSRLFILFCDSLNNLQLEKSAFNSRINNVFFFYHSECFLSKLTFDWFSLCTEPEYIFSFCRRHIMFSFFPFYGLVLLLSVLQSP